MTAQDVENGARDLYYRRSKMMPAWEHAPEEVRALYRELFLAALSFIRERAEAEFSEWRRR